MYIRRVALKDFFIQFITNKVLMCSCAGWCSAQLIKFILYLFTEKEFRLERLFGDGGMPSGHSACVTAAATGALLCYGLNSFEFAITFIVAIIVMHDAKGVRRETGKQAVVINEMMELFNTRVFTSENNKIVFHEDKLKEFVGHTPFQVMAGGILGIIIAIILCVNIYNVVL